MSVDKRMVEAVKVIANEMPNNSEIMDSIQSLETRNNELMEIENETIKLFLDDDDSFPSKSNWNYLKVITSSDKSVEEMVIDHNNIVLTKGRLSTSHFGDMKPDDACIEAVTGKVVQMFKDDTVRIVHIDTNYATLYNMQKKQMSGDQNLREVSPFKLVEREAKADAYRTAYTDFDWFVLREVAKIPELKDNDKLTNILNYVKNLLTNRYQSHESFLEEQAIMYDPSTQSFKVRQQLPKEFDVNNHTAKQHN